MRHGMFVLLALGCSSPQVDPLPLTPESVGAYRIEGPESECDGIRSTSQDPSGPVAHCFPPGTLDRLYTPGTVDVPTLQKSPRTESVFGEEDLTQPIEALRREVDP